MGRELNNVYQFHLKLIKSGHRNNHHSLRQFLILLSSYSSSYPSPQSLSYASTIFSQLQNPDTVSFNAVIKAHSNFSPLKSLSFFSAMRKNCVFPDHFTFPFVLKSISRIRFEPQCRVVHALVFKSGFDCNVFVGNGLIHCYGSCGRVEYAFKVFDELLERRDVVSWSVMIACFTNNGFAYQGLELFRKMQVSGGGDVRPDEVTIISVISAVSSLGELELGKWVDMFIRKTGYLSMTVALGTALIDMFSRCGSISDSIRVFGEMENKNLLTWTALINGLAVHGRGREAVSLFYEMKRLGNLRPDYVIFSGLLVACSHSGLINEGWKVFKSMRNEHGMEPKLEQYGCMVDLLGRAGYVDQAYEFIQQMPIKPNSVIWRTLLGACASNNDVELAQKVKLKLFELDNCHDGDYVLLSNAYGNIGSWNKKERLRITMNEKKISKNPGISMISINQELHEFVAGDKVHPRAEEIKMCLDSIIGRLRFSGYVPQTSQVLYDVENEEKERNLGYHSEKLAVAFALLCFEDKRVIRIMKNLRICHDCHSFMKHVSAMIDREIIVRDRNRFHHFSKGVCSCKDYW